MNTASPPPSSNLSSSKPWRLALLGSALGPLLALALVILFFGAADYFQEGELTFFRVRNARAVMAQSAVIAVAALGMTVIIISGGIDLSVGTAVALCATVLAWSLKEDVATRVFGSEGLTPYTPALALLLTIATGCLCGLLNGAIISYLRVVPFIVTLGTMTLYLGIAKIIANETTVRPDAATQVPAWLSELLSIREKAQWAGLPMGVWVTIGLSIALAAVLRYTVFSRYVYALGSNEATARLCGINVSLNKIAVYTLAGFFVGIAGIYQFAYLTAGNPTSGIGLELRIIAATVIGGASLSGGRGSVLGTLSGVAIMAVIDSGCTQLGLTNPIQDVILGVIIIAAVAVDQLRQRRLAG